MKVSTLPMPDEAAGSHWGRLRYLNDWHRPAAAYRLFQRALAEAGKHSEADGLLFLLAASADMKATDYARLHTMLPASQLVADLKAGREHGAVSSLVGCSGRHLRVREPAGMRICLECAREDLHFWSFSWYRRSHQLIGVDWCEKHGLPLHSVFAKDACGLTPAERIEAGEVESNPPCSLSLALAPPLVQRYVSISCATLLHAAPAWSFTINRKLSNRASALGFGSGRRTSTLGKFIARSAPCEWINLYFPEYHTTTESPIDEALRRDTYAPPGHHYALAMAALYEDADDAMLDVFGCRAVSEVRA